MKLTILLLVSLAASLWANFAAIDRTAPPFAKETPAPDPANNAPTKIPTAVIDSTKTADHPRAAALRELGLNKEQLIAVLEPEITQRCRSRIENHQFGSLDAFGGDLRIAKAERENALEDLFGDIDARLDPYRPGRTDIRYQFGPAEEEPAAILRRDIGRRADPHELSSDLPDDEARAIHRILFQVGGVALDRPAKEKLVALARENWGAPEGLSAALGTNFDPATAAQLQRCFQPGHWRAYQHATLLSDDSAERAEIAARALEAEKSRR